MPRDASVTVKRKQKGDKNQIGGGRFENLFAFQDVDQFLLLLVSHNQFRLLTLEKPQFVSELVFLCACLGEYLLRGGNGTRREEKRREGRGGERERER